MVDLSYLQRNVFPGESGGDYNALFGYSQRPGGQFAGVNLTDMTVDQALQFASPSGPYGQWVKGQVGRVATPMGAYQVVGSTLRAAKDGLGLTGSERMTPEVQDQIGQWIYQTQGPGAWEAWGKGGSTGNTDMVRGGAGQTSLLGQAGADFLASDQERPRGLLGGFFGPEGRDRRARLAVGLEGMTLNPNRALIEGLQGDITERREARAAAAQRNATVEFLRSRGREDLAAAIEGGLPATDAMRLALAPADDQRTALIKNYEYAKQAGYGGTFEEFLRSGGGGGSVVNVSSGVDESALQKELGKTIGGDVALSIKNGQQANRNLVRYNTLEQLLQSAPQGGRGAFVQLAANLGLKFEGASDIEAAQALINQLVPEQRQPGSGPMSDADLALFKQSLPRIINTPGGNQLILQTLRGIAEYDLMAADIARRLASGRIDTATYLDEMASLENPIPPQLRQSTSGSSMSGDDAVDILLGQ